MSYHDILHREISAAILGGGRTFSAPADDGSGTLVATMPQADSLSVSLEALSFQSDLLAQATTEHLSGIADHLARKLTYLLEPLRVIEIDGNAGAVQLRSHPPYQRGSQRRYFELLVQRGGSISLVRYERVPGEPRKVIGAVFTQEVFLRLADDLAEAVGG